LLKLYIAVHRELFRWPWRWKEMIQAVAHVGVDSLPIISVATAFAGLVISSEIAWHMDSALRDVSMVPGFTGRFIMRELGIVVPALLVVSKVGASMTAEVGTMKVTEQLDALKLLGIRPISYLVFPRWMGGMIALVCLTVLSSVVTLIFAMGVAVWKFNFNILEYFAALSDFIGPQDVLHAGIKAAAFGSVIPLVSCAYGFHCKGGAQGVGLATTNSVVTSTLLVIFLDFVLSYALGGL